MTIVLPEARFIQFLPYFVKYLLSQSFIHLLSLAVSIVTFQAYFSQSHHRLFSLLQGYFFGCCILS